MNRLSIKNADQLRAAVGELGSFQTFRLLEIIEHVANGDFDPTDQPAAQNLLLQLEENNARLTRKR